MKKLYQLLEDEHKMYGANIKPKQALGTRWVDLKMNAMRQIIDKYGLYVSDLQNGIADTSKKVDKTTVKGKLTKLCNANGLLCCASFTDILTPATNFNLERKNLMVLL